MRPGRAGLGAATLAAVAIGCAASAGAAGPTAVIPAYGASWTVPLCGSGADCTATADPSQPAGTLQVGVVGGVLEHESAIVWSGAAADTLRAAGSGSLTVPVDTASLRAASATLDACLIPMPPAAAGTTPPADACATATSDAVAQTEGGGSVGSFTIDLAPLLLAWRSTSGSVGLMLESSVTGDPTTSWSLEIPPPGGSGVVAEVVAGQPVSRAPTPSPISSTVPSATPEAVTSTAAAAPAGPTGNRARSGKSTPAAARPRSPITRVLGPAVIPAPAAQVPAPGRAVIPPAPTQAAAAPGPEVAAAPSPETGPAAAPSLVSQAVTYRHVGGPHPAVWLIPILLLIGVPALGRFLLRDATGQMAGGQRRVR